MIYRLAAGFLSAAFISADNIGNLADARPIEPLGKVRTFKFRESPDLPRFDFSTKDVLESLSFTWTFTAVAVFRGQYVYTDRAIVRHMRGRVDTQE